MGRSSAAPSRAVMLFGTEEPVPEAIALRAGPLEASLEAGNLRHVRLGGREAIRAVSFIVRDRDWGTYAPAITNLDVRQDADGFTVAYDALCEDAAQAFRYRARIEGRPDRLVFEAEGEALADFTTNRTGFVVLHGVEGVSGEPVEIEHAADGTVEQARFPVLISPAQPLMDVRALTHEVLPGVRVTCRMEGDAYETEDQRNWTDASYKTYVRPLAKPWPYTLKRGERFTQRVVLEVHGTTAPAATPSRPRAGSAAEEEPVAVRLGGQLPQAMPPVGLEVPAAFAEEALLASDLLAAVDFPHFVLSLLQGVTEATVDVSIRQMDAYGELIARCGTQATVLEAVVPCRDADGNPTADSRVMRRDLERLAAVVRRAGAEFDLVAVSPACDLKSCQPTGPWPPAPDLADLYDAARELFPDARIGGGTFAFFTELNRKRPPAEALDFVCHTTCPIVHAADDLSLTESLEALPSVFRSVRAFAGGRPYWLFPTAIAARHSPYGAAPAGNPGGGRVAMAGSDPREQALAGAAWYAGYLAHAARAGLEAVTLGAAAGPSGVVRNRGSRAQPWFDQIDAPVFPSFHVLRGHAEIAGQSLVAVETSAPRDVQALAVATPSGTRVWLTNLTGRRRRVRVEGAAASRAARLCCIDTITFERLCRTPDCFELLAEPASPDGIELGAYAVVRLDLLA